MAHKTSDSNRRQTSYHMDSSSHQAATLPLAVLASLAARSITVLVPKVASLEDPDLSQDHPAHLACHHTDRLRQAGFLGKASASHLGHSHLRCPQALPVFTTRISRRWVHGVHRHKLPSLAKMTRL